MVRNGIDGPSLLDETIEQHPPALRCPAVESEGELVQIVVEIISCYRALVSPQQPALQKTRNPVDPGQ